MSKPFQIPATGDERRNDRCSLRPLTAEALQSAGADGSQLVQIAEQFGHCSRGNCADCPLSKCSDSSSNRIERGDTVRTHSGRRFTFSGFEQGRTGLRTGYVLLNGSLGGVRLPLADVQLHHKRAHA